METVIVEVILKTNSCLNNEKATVICDMYLKSNKLRTGTLISKFDPETDSFLFENVQHIIIAEHERLKNDYIDFSSVNINWFVYTLDNNERQIENEYDEDGEGVRLATIQVLPSAEYYDLWENLIYDINIKNDLLEFANTALYLADNKVNSNIISCNRVVLLHGPPGTGKTSLCRALAHKLSIRLNNRFKRGFLLEVNSHSLFSKWFSESGKLVTKMFEKVTDILRDPEAIVFLLVDEIESLTHARIKCAGTEPSDAIRVVNAVLTQIDYIRNYPNVLILATSNMEGSIDLAFIDRADIKQYIGLPGPEAIYQIYYSCIQELMRVQIIRPAVMLPPINMYYKFEDSNVAEYSKELLQISESSVGFSGRTLRKLPFVALAVYTKKKTLNINEFFYALIKAVQYHRNNEKYFMGDN
ncbi:hypothetical protein ILUMI_26429 [Ignelater luminosus]|uniref:AAA+ ATPase domain-containing protein n=1 Tax=Ignelater luminosus TaxID=2038154 RepID=A0A8K0C8H3_IGNLU|nr:hypothetical protein ILUMI_26429 [Ignelater luminosus]